MVVFISGRHGFGERLAEVGRARNHDRVRVQAAEQARADQVVTIAWTHLALVEVAQHLAELVAEFLIFLFRCRTERVVDEPGFGLIQNQLDVARVCAAQDIQPRGEQLS